MRQWTWVLSNDATVMTLWWTKPTLVCEIHRPTATRSKVLGLGVDCPLKAPMVKSCCLWWGIVGGP